MTDWEKMQEMFRGVTFTHTDLTQYDDHRTYSSRQEVYADEQGQKPGRDNDRERRERK